MDFILGKGCTTDKVSLCPRDGNNAPRIDNDGSNSRLDDSSASLGLRSGFMSLKERFSSLAKQSEHQTSKRQKKSTESSPQFANLQEFFSSKHHCKQREPDKDEHGLRRTKIPIMRLKKNDWNVKCWEDRLSSHKKRPAKHRGSSSLHPENPDDGSRLNETKPKLQVEVFNGRISDVANKLDKIREGAPQDEMLYQLASNRLMSKRTEPTKEWTSLLKDELSRGAHNPKILEAQFACIGKEQQAVGNSRRKECIKSPIGRYIGRLVDDDQSDDDSGADSQICHQQDDITR